ncbi:hypothetical protein BCA37_10740 [Mycobacterium sp. djl-10]|nr:hypothetical protein BCA37_10740 [Mycobacterium sp. djl-10]
MPLSLPRYGGGDDPGGDPGDQPDGDPPAGGQPDPSGSDKGFPEGTAVKDMTPEQQAAYYRFHNRKAEGQLSAFKGVTPKQVQDMQAELEGLRDKQLTADQKAIKDAEKAGRAAADAEWAPRLQTAQLRSIAGEVLKGDELESWMFGRNAAAFAGDDGEIDREKVMGILTAKYGGDEGQQPGNQPPPVWGQHSGGSGAPPAKPGEAGLAAAQKRFKTTT